MHTEDAMGELRSIRITKALIAALYVAVIVIARLLTPVLGIRPNAFSEIVMLDTIVCGWLVRPLTERERRILEARRGKGRNGAR